MSRETSSRRVPLIQREGERDTVRALWVMSNSFSIVTNYFYNYFSHHFCSLCHPSILLLFAATSRCPDLPSRFPSLSTLCLLSSFLPVCFFVYLLTWTERFFGSLCWFDSGRRSKARACSEKAGSTNEWQTCHV
ncbi:hypothetical protein BKA80DRAFT_10075 [Phyllosticta citrichinensis]